jgi:hypothetical protein
VCSKIVVCVLKDSGMCAQRLVYVCSKISGMCAQRLVVCVLKD